MTPRLIRIVSALAPAEAPVEATPGIRWAAVAVVLAPNPDSLLLIRRAERAGDPWSGHMAFPGGRHDPADRDLIDTAIRETQEELSLDLPRTSLVGRLPDVAPQSPLLPPIAVRPFVFLLDQQASFTPGVEVAAASWVPLDALAHATARGSYELEHRGERRTFPAYHLDVGVVWGMTERILSGLGL